MLFMKYCHKFDSNLLTILSPVCSYSSYILNYKELDLIIFDIRCHLLHCFMIYGLSWAKEDLKGIYNWGLNSAVTIWLILYIFQNVIVLKEGHFGQMKRIFIIYLVVRVDSAYLCSKFGPLTYPRNNFFKWSKIITIKVQNFQQKNTINQL